MMAYASNTKISTTKKISIREPGVSRPLYSGLQPSEARLLFCLSSLRSAIRAYGPSSRPLSLSENEFSGLQPSKLNFYAGPFRRSGSAA